MEKTLVPDTSVVAEQVFLEAVSSLSPSRILIPNTVLRELEHQANQGRSIGFAGLDHLNAVREYASKHDIEVSTSSESLSGSDVHHAKNGSLDARIRQIAFEEGAVLVTADRVQARVAQAAGIAVEFVDFSIKQHKGSSHEDPLAHFFIEGAMSVHIKEGAKCIRKVGSPGNWVFEEFGDVFTGVQVSSLAKHIKSAAHQRSDSFIEIAREASTVVQLGRYRIVIAHPPFASRWEITAVRPVKQLHLEDYEFPESFQKRLESKAEGILVAGSPGEGKSTFTQALGEFYASMDKIVKTVEAPRDLVLPDSITQYSASHGSPEEIRDVLLLNRPDYTIYDEIRNNQDFQLYADMRLSGIGMVGVVHAASAVDAIQRFIGRIELGMVPQVVDTVVYIKGGKIAKVLSLSMAVKTPAGMTEADLARPVIVVSDFFLQKPEYEMYTFSDQTMVVPISASTTDKPKSAVLEFAKQGFKEYFAQFDERIQVELLSEKEVVVHVPKKLIPQIIGKGGERIRSIEDDLGVRVDVKELTASAKEGVKYRVKTSKSQLTVMLPAVYANRDVDFYAFGEFVMGVTASKQALVKVSLKSDLGSKILRAYEKGSLEIVT